MAKTAYSIDLHLPYMSALCVSIPILRSLTFLRQESPVNMKFESRLNHSSLQIVVRPMLREDLTFGRDSCSTSQEHVTREHLPAVKSGASVEVPAIPVARTGPTDHRLSATASPLRTSEYKQMNLAHSSYTCMNNTSSAGSTNVSLAAVQKQYSSASLLVVGAYTTTPQ